MQVFEENGVLVVHGGFCGLKDYDVLKSALQDQLEKGKTELEIHMADAEVLPSSVIGLFSCMAEHKQIRLLICVPAQLLNLLSIMTHHANITFCRL